MSKKFVITQTIEVNDDGVHCGDNCNGLSETGNGAMGDPIVFHCKIYNQKLRWGKWKEVARCSGCLYAEINSESHD